MYYKVLKKPTHTKYRGLHRAEPCPSINNSTRFIQLWDKYVNESYDKLGITTQLSIPDLCEFAALASNESGEAYELIAFCNCSERHDQWSCLGYDVAGFGGYSMLSERLFNVPKLPQSGELPISSYYREINRIFLPKINRHGLLPDADTASALSEKLLWIGENFSECEHEAWRAYCIMKVC